MTVDGTDFRIYEPGEFDARWFSHKFHGPGVRYEVGIAIQTGHIVWVNGPFPCGAWPDLRISRDWIIHELQNGEMLLADGGYADGGQYFDTPTGLNNAGQYMRSVARARHETVNRRFKEWGILERRFRHKLVLHTKVFQSIANITQLELQHQSPLFSIDYDDSV